MIRYSLPDAAKGGGTSAALDLYVNAEKVRTLALTSKYSWLYGQYPFSNQPAQGKPRNFYNDIRVKGVTIGRNDLVRIQRADSDAAYCIVDLVDLENVSAPCSLQRNRSGLLDFGADQKGVWDASDALRTAWRKPRSRAGPSGSWPAPTS